MTGARARQTILCVGRLYCDLVFSDVPRFPTMGTEVYAGGLTLTLGGGAFITAAHLASLHCNAALACFIPAEPFRDFCRKGLASAKVDSRFCANAAPGIDPQVTAIVSGADDRAFLTRRDGPAFPMPSPGALISAGIGHVHVAELASLAEQPDIVDVAREAGASLSVDCAWDEALGPSDAGLVQSVDVFLPNSDEAERLRQLGVAEPWAPLTVIKRGPNGAEALTDGQKLQAPASPVKAIDTTGAGDAFNAGFLASWLDGKDLPACLASGNQLGAKAVQVLGGAPRP